MDNTRIPSLILRWCKDSPKDNWATRTRTLLNGLNLSQLAIDNLPHDAWEALISSELAEWQASVNTLPSTRNSESGGRFLFYRQYKLEPNTEPYIKLSISRNKRRVITMLRCGCLPLAIELGRYRSPKTPLNQRTCPICNSEELEDECHFLTSCNTLHTQRSALFREVSKLSSTNFYHLSPHDKTVAILQYCASNNSIGSLVTEMYFTRQSYI